MTSNLDSIVQQLSGATLELNSKLSYSGKGLKLDTEEDAKNIEREIEEFQNLETLCLEGNTVGIDAAKAIARGLKNHPELKCALWSDMFTGRMKTEIPPALKYLSDAMMLSEVKLVELDLSDNAFGPNGIRGVEALLRSEVCFTLTTLKLNNNGLGTFGGKILSDCLLECYEKSCATGTPMGLKTFVSGRGRLENDGAKGMSAVFKKMKSLEHVAMPQNGIQYPGITELAGAFSHCINLKHLNLNDNTFTAKGAKSMADSLPHLQNLEVLNLGDCLIRTEGAVLLAAALKDGHENLKELILCGNEIQREGGVSIASSISNKEHLEKVELGANYFGEDGVFEIKSLFESIGADEILDSMSDDEGSELDDDEDPQNAETDEEKDEDVKIIHSDMADIQEDPSISQNEESPPCLVIDDVHNPEIKLDDNNAADSDPVVAQLEPEADNKSLNDIDTVNSEINQCISECTTEDPRSVEEVENGSAPKNTTTTTNVSSKDQDVEEDLRKIAEITVQNAMENAIASMNDMPAVSVIESNAESPDSNILGDTLPLDNSIVSMGNDSIVSKSSTPSKKKKKSKKNRKNNENNIDEIQEQLENVNISGDTASPRSKNRVKQKDCIIL